MLTPGTDDVYKFAERNLHGFEVQVVAASIWFYNISHTANTERYSVFCILVNSFYMQLVAG